MVRDDVPNETHRSVVTAFRARPGRGADAVTSTATSPPGGHHTGATRHPQGLDRAGVHLPAATGLHELLAKVDAWLETSSANPGAIPVRAGGPRRRGPRYLAGQAKDAELILWGAGIRWVPSGSGAYRVISRGSASFTRYLVKPAPHTSACSVFCGVACSASMAIAAGREAVDEVAGGEDVCICGTTGSTSASLTSRRTSAPVTSRAAARPGRP